MNRLFKKRRRLQAIYANISTAQLGANEIRVLQMFIDLKPDGEYELPEILGSANWSKVLRKRLLGVIFSRYVSLGMFRNIVCKRITTDSHAHYTIVKPKVVKKA